MFTKTAAGWKQAAELKGSDTVAGDYFGGSVAISGTTAVVGAAGHATYAGRAYVFTKTAAGWKQAAELKGSDTVAGDYFGDSVAISGTTAVVGAETTPVCRPGIRVHEDGGRLEADRRTEGLRHRRQATTSATRWPSRARPSWWARSSQSARPAGRTCSRRRRAGWKQADELKGSDTVAGDGFGWSVGISGTTAVVGAPYYRKKAGRAYVFTKSAGVWKQTAALEGSDTVSGNVFGFVAISGTTAVVGAPDYHNFAGRAYVFEV